MRQRKSKLRRLWLFALVAAGLIGCGDGVLADGDDVVYLTPFNHDAIEVDHVQDRGPAVAPHYEETYRDDQQDYEQINTQFITHADRILADSGIIEALGSFERSFVFSGRYLEMVSIYQQHNENYGVGPVATPGLAWALVRLGNEPAATAIIDELVETRPDDPHTWVVVGKFHGRRANLSLDSARQAKEAYERIFELDPNFSGFKTMTPQRLDQELASLVRMVPDEPVAEAEDAGSQDGERPMHHTDDRALGVDTAAGQTATEDGETDAEQRAQQAADAVDNNTLEVVEDVQMTVEEYVADAFPDQLPADEIERLAEEPDEVEDDGQASERPRASLHVARGHRAMQQGGDDNLRRAEQHFETALEIDSTNIEAGIGLLRIGANTGAPDDMLADQVDTLSDHDLTARQAYELALFSLRRLNDRQRATSLLDRVEHLDPSFARRVNVDSLID